MIKKKKKITPLIYQSCSEIPIYNFMMYLHTMDAKLLISNLEKFDEEVIEKFISSNSKKISKSINKIEKEYQALTFEKRDLNKNKEIASMMFLEVKHNTISKVVSIFMNTGDVSVLDLLNDLGVGFNIDKPIAKQLEKARRTNKGIRNKINIKQANFKKKYKIDENVKTEYEPADVEINLDAQALTMEGNLETGYKINIKKTSVLRWVNLMEANRRRIDEFNKL